MREVFCLKYKEKLEGLSAPPDLSEQGAFVFENLSKKAWQDWLKEQTRLINENKLSLRKPEARQYLKGQLDRFLRGEEFEQYQSK